MKFCKIKLIFLLILLCLRIAPISAQVQVEELPDNMLDAYGLDKTLPFTSWGDVSFDILTEVTEDLAKQKQSAALANLTAAVLIQPTFIQTTGWTEDQSKRWLLLRLQSLINLGHFDKALQMMEQLPVSLISTDVLKLKMDSYFLQDEWRKACTIALQNSTKDVYFNQTQMFCLGLMGEKDKALMAFDLWKEEHLGENIASFIMGQLMEIPVLEPKSFDALTVADVFVLKQLKSPYLEKITLPLAWQKLNGKFYSGFGRAINATKLLEIWKNAGLTEDEQAYRFYLLSSYVDLFLPELRFIRRDILWHYPMSNQTFSLRAAFLKDKPESQITGFDLLLALWLLHKKSVDINNALIILSKGGLHLENYVLELLNP